MLAPSVKTLERAFPNKGKELRKALTENLNATLRSRLEACSNILNMHGVESIRSYKSNSGDVASCLYVNSGDTYRTTILFNGNNIIVGNWGDWVEGREKRGFKFA